MRVFVETPWAFVILFAAIYGVSFADFEEFKILSLHPFALHPHIDRQYLQSSPFTFLVSHPLTLWLGSRLSFMATSLTGLVFFFYCFTRFLRFHFAGNAKWASTLFFSSPLLLVVLTWIGKSDPFLMGFFCLLTIASRFAACAVCALLMVTSHREMAMVMLLTYGVLFRKKIPAILAGAGIGLALIYVYHHHLLPQPPQSRMAFPLDSMRVLLDRVFSSPISHLILTFGPFWAVILAWRRPSTKQVMAFAVCLCAATLSTDYTRVFVITALPLMFHVITVITSPEHMPDDGARLMRLRSFLPALSLLQAQFVPPGVLRDSMLPHLLNKLISP